MTSLPVIRSVIGAAASVARTAGRVAAIGVLVAAAWDDDDPVPHDPLISA